MLRIRDHGSNFFHPGSASKNLSIFNPKNWHLVLKIKIRDVYPGFAFFHPASRIQGRNISGSRIRGSSSKNFSIFNHKTVSKLFEKFSWMFIPDPNFFPIPDPRAKKHRIPVPDSQHCWYLMSVFRSVTFIFPTTLEGV